MNTPFHFKCEQCSTEYKRDEVQYLCPRCSVSYKPGIPLVGVLSTVFDTDFIKKHFNKAHPDWELFSAVEAKYFPQFPVGNTPFFRVDALAKTHGLQNVWIKNDGMNPSGSLKDRASFLVVAEAIRKNESTIVTASTGNAASALAAVCAAAGKKAIIYVPATAPIAKLVQMRVYGAEVITVQGTYDDAFALSLEHTRTKGGLNRNTAYHPLTIEGKKTVGLEILQQNGWITPDVIVVPVGDGVIIAGVFKAFSDLKAAHIISKLPRLICVQAESSNAIHRYIHSGVYEDAANPTTCADSISVRTPSNAHLARRAVLETGGTSITVSEEQIKNAIVTLARTSGIFVEPASAATVAALQILKKKELVASDEQIVLLITANGLKDIATPVEFLKSESHS
jgi:threonine synthase